MREECYMGPGRDSKRQENCRLQMGLQAEERC
jgi:hypothetical protein